MQFSEEEKLKIIKLYNEGTTVQEICKIFSAYNQVIREVLVGANIPIAKKPKLYDQTVAKLCSEGYSTAEIAKIIGRQHQYVYRQLKRQGLKSAPSKLFGLSTLLPAEEFLTRAKQKFGDRFDYSDTEYKNMKIPICIKCKIHGKFTQMPDHHLKSVHSCPKCVLDWRELPRREQLQLTTQEIIQLYQNGKTSQEIAILAHCSNVLILDILRENNIKITPSAWDLKPPDILLKEFAEVHGNKYDYSLVDYRGGHKSIIIGCPIHGNFSQRPHGHLTGQGCPKCGKEKLHGFQRDRFIANCVKKGVSPILYLIHIFNTCESFVKIGVTQNSTKDRFPSKSALPYEFKELHTVVGSAAYVWDLEHLLHRICKPYKYAPQRPFGGQYECYNITNLPEILEIWNKETHKTTEILTTN
jgi:transposase-like protein